MNKKDIAKECMKIFWIFIIGSVIGYILETIVVICQKGYFESRQGVIYGPFTPVYGIGGVFYYLLFSKIKTRNIAKVFLISMIIGGTIEYLCSFFQEKFFGTISWDYSNLAFNLNGRTSLLHCTYWGLLGIFYIICIEPLISKMEDLCKNKAIKILTAVLAVFMTANIIISWMAGNRQKERTQGIPAQDKVDVFLDKYYPDEKMDKVYTNKKTVPN